MDVPTGQVPVLSPEQVAQINSYIDAALNDRERVNQYQVTQIPSHVHNGTDSQPVDYNNLVNIPVITFSSGDGTDGAVDFDGTTTVLGLVPSSSVYTLTRDINPTNMIVRTGVQVKTSNYRIFCDGTLTNAGKIGSYSANAAVDVAGLRQSGGYWQPAGSGGAGGTGVGADGQSKNPNVGGNGGAGGAGGTGAAGAAGTATPPSASTGSFFQYPTVLQNYVTDGATFTQLQGAGAGGSAGGGDSTNKGGGGGGGGGIAFISAPTIINTNGIFSCAGGAGGTNTVGNTGGGGGGGGGLLVLMYHTLLKGTEIAAGGAKGLKHGSGVNGVAGVDGTVLKFVI